MNDSQITNVLIDLMSLTTSEMLWLAALCLPAIIFLLHDDFK